MPSSNVKKSTKTTRPGKSAGTTAAKKRTTKPGTVKSARRTKSAAETVSARIPELPITPVTDVEHSIDAITTNITGIGSGTFSGDIPAPEEIPVLTSPPDTELEIPQEFRSNGFDISRKVLARIALIAAGEVEGLAPPKKDPFNRLIDTLQGRTDGIRVDVGTTEAAVDMQIRVRFGSDIPDITTRLRERVATRIREMTGLHVVEVNIRVQDVTVLPPAV